jgi:hypothetical protein
LWGRIVFFVLDDVVVVVVVVVVLYIVQPINGLLAGALGGRVAGVRSEGRAWSLRVSSMAGGTWGRFESWRI